jgi:hypothetical protein
MERMQRPKRICNFKVSHDKTNKTVHNLGTSGIRVAYYTTQIPCSQMERMQRPNALISKYHMIK